MTRLPPTYRWILALGGLLAPRAHAEAWRREWTAELWFALRSERGRALLAVRTVSCLIDAVWLWRRESTMNGWTKDLSVAVRGYLRAPALTLVMLTTLGLGLGATATIYAVVRGVILEDLPVPEPRGLIRFGLSAPQRGIADWPFSYAQFRDLSENLRSADVAVVSGVPFNLVTDDGPVRIMAARSSDTYFPITGLQPVLGRAFTRAEEAAGARLAVVSHEFWRRHLSASPEVIGRALTLAGDVYEVIGVMPPGTILAQQILASGGAPDVPIDVYIPLQEFGSKQGDLVSTLRMVGRVRDTSSIDDVRAEAGGRLTDFMEARGRTDWETHVADLRDHLIGPVRTPLLVMLGAVGVLLTMVCVNLSGLILVRGVGRSSEWAARQALGANPFRIVRQLVTEAGVLSVVAGTIAVVFTSVAVRALRTAAVGHLPRAEELTTDLPTIAFAVLLVMSATAVFGLVPAMATYRRSPADALTTRGQTLSAGGRRGLRGLVATEVALAIVLLVGSGVLIRSFANLVAQDPGYSHEGVLRANTQLDSERYTTDDEIVRFVDDLSQRLGEIPGVEALALSAMPNPTQGPRKLLQKDGLAGADNQGAAFENAVTPSYFEVIGIELIEGRVFTAADDMSSPPVSVITKALAEQLWPGESAVGKRVSTGSWRRFNQTGVSTDPVLREVVGVVEDLSGVGLDPGGPGTMLFSPMSQEPWLNQTILLKVPEGVGDPAAETRAALAAVDPDQPLFGVEPAIVDLRNAIGTERVSTQLLTGFALAALLLSILGIYGVVAYSVVLRRREIGIRMAVGADARAVSGLFFRDGLGPVIAGLVIGVVAAFYSVALLEGMLFGVSPLDPVAFGGAGALLAVAGILSTYLPARRTTRVDPVEALRQG